jgi:DNA replication and repair protein RecF
VLIKNLKINNLRNLKSVDLEAHPKLNLLIGENGAGKTTVLESLLVLAKGRSFRSVNASALIGPETSHFRVNAKILHSSNREHSLGMERTADKWRARRDGEDVKQLGDLAADLPIVLMEPNSHLLVSGPPDGRRKFLDWAVFHVEHSYLGTWRRYSRALKQRNSALRAKDTSLVQSLDPLVTDLGEKIDGLRQDLSMELGSETRRQLSMLSLELPGISLRYRSGWSGDSLRIALESSLARDMERGATGPGPHRADIVISVDDRPAREILSRGEQKAMAAALLLAQAEMMVKSGEQPVLLLDDLASELDARHRDNLLSLGMQGAAQLWITGTAADPYLSVASHQRRLFHVEQGKITTETTA